MTTRTQEEGGEHARPAFLLPAPVLLHIARFLPPTGALLRTLGSTSQDARRLLVASGCVQQLSLDPFRLHGATAPDSVAAMHALARLLALLAPHLERLKGPWEHPPTLALFAMALALVTPRDLAFPRLHAFETVYTSEHGKPPPSPPPPTATTPHPFLLLLAHHAKRFPALAHLRLATEWPGKHGWALPMAIKPSFLALLSMAHLAPRLETLEIDTAFLGGSIKVGR